VRHPLHGVLLEGKHLTAWQTGDSRMRVPQDAGVDVGLAECSTVADVEVLARAAILYTGRGRGAKRRLGRGARPKRRMSRRVVGDIANGSADMVRVDRQGHLCGNHLGKGRAEMAACHTEIANALVEMHW
jgi:hypothetical protein